METMVLDVRLNGENKGEFFVNLTDDKDFLVKDEDLKSMGISTPGGKVTDIGGEQFVSLSSIPGTSFSLNDKTLSLDINVNPELLPKKVIDFRAGTEQKVYYPKDSSLFLNYGANYLAGDSFRFQNFSLTNELGARWKNLLFLTNSTFTKSDSSDKFLRLLSNVTHDDRSTLRRWVVGDFFTLSGDLGSSLNLGGVSFSKVYRMDPYYINYPTLDFSGNVALPSEAEIYLDGVRVRTEKLAPGTFELRNLTTYSGSGVVEVVIKDAFGRVQRIRNPFYFSDTLLKKGLHEYSYNLGFTREDYGTTSNRYSTLALSAFHRYGVSDSLTVGVTAEGKNGLYNGGMLASFVLPPVGLFSVSLSGSSGSGNSGTAGSASYTYQGKAFSGRVFARGFSRDYRNLSGSLSTDRTKYDFGANAGYVTRRFGSISLDFFKTVKHQGEDRQVASATYTRNITNNSNISATYRRVKELGSSNEFLVSLNYYPWAETSLSARYEKTGDSNTQTLQLQKNAPVGEGFGYRASVERKETGGSDSIDLNPYIQYNGPFGIYTAEFRGQTGNGGMDESYNLTAAGSIAYLGNSFGLLRPVHDSFGLVKVGEQEGVRVYQNSQEIGRTGKSGRVFVPNLGSFYDNQISINDKDISMEYTIDSVRKVVSPPLRSGSCISFGVTRLQPVIGRLAGRLNGEVKPLEFYEVSVKIGERDITFPTGKDGEFYLDINQPDGTIAPSGREMGCADFEAESGRTLRPGTYQALVNFNGKEIPFRMAIPPSEEMFIDLGTIVVEGASP